LRESLENTQNHWHQWLSRVHQIRFRPRLRPRSRWGSLQRSPDSLAGLRGPTSKGGREKEGKERKGLGEGKEREEKKGREREEKGWDKREGKEGEK